MSALNTKEQFIEIYTSLIKREGADKLLEWLERSDFFTAPASTRFHGAYEGGLAEHSVNVYRRLCELSGSIQGAPESIPETLAIVALLHDVCKVGMYVADFRNQKDERGVWQRVPFYKIEEQLPFGHGEKSVYVISGFMKLTREEAIAIRYHMGPWASEVKGGDNSVSKAFEMCPLALLVHQADMLASYLDERR